MYASRIADFQAYIIYSLGLSGRHQTLNRPHVCTTPTQVLFQNRVRPPEIVMTDMCMANGIPNVGDLAPDSNQTRFLRVRS